MILLLAAAAVTSASQLALAESVSRAALNQLTDRPFEARLNASGLTPTEYFARSRILGELRGIGAVSYDFAEYRNDGTQSTRLPSLARPIMPSDIPSAPSEIDAEGRRVPPPANAPRMPLRYLMIEQHPPFRVVPAAPGSESLPTVEYDRVRAHAARIADYSERIARLESMVQSDPLHRDPHQAALLRRELMAERARLLQRRADVQAVRPEDYRPRSAIVVIDLGDPRDVAAHANARRTAEEEIRRLHRHGGQVTLSGLSRNQFERIQDMQGQIASRNLRMPVRISTLRPGALFPGLAGVAIGASALIGSQIGGTGEARAGELPPQPESDQRVIVVPRQRVGQ